MLKDVVFLIRLSDKSNQRNWSAWQFNFTTPRCLTADDRLVLSASKYYRKETAWRNQFEETLNNETNYRELGKMYVLNELMNLRNLLDNRKLRYCYFFSKILMLISYVCHIIFVLC